MASLRIRQQLGGIMKALTVLICLMLASCGTHRIKFNNTEKCVSQGYIDTGVVQGGDKGSAFDMYGNIIFTSNASSRLQCSRPRTKYEKCMLKNLLIPVSEAVKFNDEVRKDDMLLALLYGSVIGIPVAIPLNVVWAKDNDKKREEVLRNIEIASKHCNKFK